VTKIKAEADVNRNPGRDGTPVFLRGFKLPLGHGDYCFFVKAVTELPLSTNDFWASLFVNDLPRGEPVLECWLFSRRRNIPDPS
jgi:hypothetical protein